MKRKNESRNTNHESRIRAGSALILVVVLTSLLAIVGVMFVMVARVDRIATSAISENKTLDYAVEAVIARISQELVLDVPRLGQDYYDYPDANNAWLASLEPYKDGTDYEWRQISDVTGYIEKAILGEKNSWETEDVEIDIIEDHRKIELDPNGNIEDTLILLLNDESSAHRKSLLVFPFESVTLFSSNTSFIHFWFTCRITSLALKKTRPSNVFNPAVKIKLSRPSSPDV